MRTRVLTVAALAVGLLAAAAFGAKPKKPKEKFFFKIVEVEHADGIAVEAVDGPSRQILLDLVAARPDDFVGALDGAPDPKTDPEPFTKYLKKKKLRAFDVRIKFNKYERKLLPMEGTSDQMLSVEVELEVLGLVVPDSTLGFVGKGSAEVTAQVSKKLPPKMDAAVHHDALSGALTQALDEAVRELRITKAAKPAKK
jgi:hypothetical protein